MRDTALYRQLLGLETPWTVDRVELDVQQQRVFAKHDKLEAWRCSECGKLFGLHDHDEERVWRQLDSRGFQTFLHARIARVNCLERGVR